MRAGVPSWVAALRSRILGMVSRGVVRRVNDGPMLQELDVDLLGKTPKTGQARRGALAAEHFHPYGLSSSPLPGSEAALVFCQGDPAHPLVVAVSDRRERPTGLSAGEVVLYSNAGQRVHLKADGTLRVSSPTKVEVDAPEVALTADQTIAATSGGVLTLEAVTSLQLKVGTSTITLTPAGIVIAAPLVSVNQA